MGIEDNPKVFPRFGDVEVRQVDIVGGVWHFREGGSHENVA